MELFRELDVKYRTVEKDLVRFLSRNSHREIQNSEKNFFEKFGEFYSSAIIESDDEKRKLIQKLKDIKLQVRNCKTIIQSLSDKTDVTPTAAEKLENELQICQSSIFGFKNERRSEFDQFSARESQLQREIDTLNKRVELYERDEPTESESRSNSRSQGDVRKSSFFGHVDSRPVAVQKFQDFIAKRGQTDGWNEVDHNNFVKAWKKLSDGTGDVWNEEELIANLESDLPGRTEENIIKHIQFYRIFRKLKTAQQSEIEKWKRERKEKQEISSTKPPLEKKSKVISEKTKIEKEKRLQDLSEWKKNKEMLKAEQRKHVQEDHARVKRLEMDEIRERKRILHMRDLQRQHQKDAEKLIKEAEIREREEERREKAILANQNVKGLTARDVYARKCLAMERSEEIRAKIISSEISEAKRQQRNDQMASWDPTRLHQPTESNRRRLLSDEIKKQPKRTFILQRGGVAPVSWRSGL